MSLWMGVKVSMHGGFLRNDVYINASDGTLAFPLIVTGVHDCPDELMQILVM